MQSKTSTGRTGRSLFRRLLLATICAAALAVAVIPVTRFHLLNSVLASNPGSTAITVPSTIGQTVVVNWSGSIPPLANGTSDCSKLADTPAVDQHVSTISVPAGVYNSLNAKFTFNIKWDNADNDEILTVIKPDGTTLASSDGGVPSETVQSNNLGGGAYKIVACGFTSVPNPQPYTGSLTIETTSNATPTPDRDACIDAGDALRATLLQLRSRTITRRRCG